MQVKSRCFQRTRLLFHKKNHINHCLSAQGMGNGNGGRLRLIATPSGWQLATQIEKWLREKYIPERHGLEKTVRSPARSVFVPTTFYRFADSDGKVEINEHIRGDDVFIITDVASHATAVANDPSSKKQGYITRTGPDGISLERNKTSVEPSYEKLPIDVNFQQVLSTIDATKTALKTSGRITVVMPYFPSARQERREGRDSLDLALRLRMLAAAGADHVLALDPHTKAIDLAAPLTMGLDRLRASHTLRGHLLTHAEEGKYRLNHLHFVGPDKSAYATAEFYAQTFGGRAGMMYKLRDMTSVNSVTGSLGYLGEDFKGLDTILTDDMIDTAGTIQGPAGYFRTAGSASVWLMAVHPVFSYPAVERLSTAYEQGTINGVIVTNSITLPEAVLKEPWLSVADITQYHAKVIDAIHNNESISSLLDDPSR
jgi:ribose-phosphate pyrophosphokinase